MTKHGKNPKATKKQEKKSLPQKDVREPDWANGLRQLYDSVVDEPLPDSFNDLLDKLDDESKST